MKKMFFVLFIISTLFNSDIIAEELTERQVVPGTNEKYNNLRYDTIYEVNGSKVYFDSVTNTITGSDILECDVFEIPEKINGYDVKKIANYAFSGNNAKKIIMPDTVTEIGEYSFYGSKTTKFQLSKNLKYIGYASFTINDLSELVLPDGLLETGPTIFHSVPNVILCDPIYVPKSVAQIGGSNASLHRSTYRNLNFYKDEPNLPYHLFNIINDEAMPLSVEINNTKYKYFSSGNCIIGTNSSQEEILEIPSEIEGSKIYTLTGNVNANNLKEIRIGEGIKNILTGFSVNADIIRIPSTVEYISTYNRVLPIFNCKEIIVDENNPYYTSVDGVLYSKDMKKMIAYPTLKEDETFRIPSSVEAVYWLQQSKPIYKYLKTLYIPKTVKFIETNMYGAYENIPVVYVEENSYADSLNISNKSYYQDNNEYDENTFTSSDAASILAYSLNNDYQFDEEGKIYSFDVDLDNQITASDASLVLSKVLDNDFILPNKIS